MDEKRRDTEGDVNGPAHGDVSADSFHDWDNPEDSDDDAPEGYYDGEDDEDDDGYDDGYIPEPGDPDYDLSEAAGYAGYEEPARSGIFPQWVIATFCILLILAVFLGLLVQTL